MNFTHQNTTFIAMFKEKLSKGLSIIPFKHLLGGKEFREFRVVSNFSKKKKSTNLQFIELFYCLVVLPQKKAFVRLVS